MKKLFIIFVLSAFSPLVMADLLPSPELRENVVCTAEYAPVCAKTTNSGAITFSNKCVAENASNFDVILFEGTCEEQNSIGLANPAAVSCLKKGGVLEKDGDSTNCNIGGQTCEQWAYFRGECSIEAATKLETGWNTIYEKYTKNKSSNYKKVLLESLSTKLEDLIKKEVSNDKSTLYAHLSYLINEAITGETK